MEHGSDSLRKTLPESISLWNDCRHLIEYGGGVFLICRAVFTCPMGVGWLSYSKVTSQVLLYSVGLISVRLQVTEWLV